MLYDKRWDKIEVAADPFSLESLIAWLEKQPADETYCYLDRGHCLLGQYFSSHGFREVKIFSFGSWDHDGRSDRYPVRFDRISCEGRRTFGAALFRAKAEMSH